MTPARLPATEKVLYGGDYHHEQWPRDVWEDDYAAFDEASIDTVTLAVFGWSYLQPAQDVYDFSRLDEIVARAVEGGRRIVLATSTGALPPWLAHAHPEVNRTDFEGRAHAYGQRHNACPSSPVYRRLSAELAGRVAERYAGTPGLVAWHVGNEYGGYDGGCWCERCAVRRRPGRAAWPRRGSAHRRRSRGRRAGPGVPRELQEHLRQGVSAPRFCRCRQRRPRPG